MAKRRPRSLDARVVGRGRIIQTRALCRRNALIVPDERWRPEIDRLVERLEGIIRIEPVPPVSESNKKVQLLGFAQGLVSATEVP